MSSIEPNPAERRRLEQEKNIWLATVKPNGTPHLVPVWFVWLDDRAYIRTARRSVKARNIERNPSVTFALEDGNDPVVISGQARFISELPESVRTAFREKYDWDIAGDRTYDTLIEITMI